MRRILFTQIDHTAACHEILEREVEALCPRAAPALDGLVVDVCGRARRTLEGMGQTTFPHKRPGVLDRFLISAADGVAPGQRPRLQSLAVAAGDRQEECQRAAELLTRLRDWSASALGQAGHSVPMLPPRRVSTGDDAFRLLQVLEPVSDELGDGADEPALRRLLAAAIAAARSGLQLGPLPAGGLGSVRAPGVGAHVVEEVAPTDEDLLEIGRRAGQGLVAWAAAGLGDPVTEAAETVRAAAGPSG